MPDDNDFRLKYMYKFRDNKDIRNLKYDYFIIRNSFLSKKNDRYCVSTNYKISFERFTPYDKDKQWIFDSFEKVDGRYSFEKLGKLWYGSEGWGK